MKKTPYLLSVLSFKKLCIVLFVMSIAFSCSEEEPAVEMQEVAPDETAIETNEDIIGTLENWELEVNDVEPLEGKDAGAEDARRRFFRIPTFFTLVKALIKTDLLGPVVRNELTVFAPTDNAFAKLGIYPWNVGRVENLEEILLYHVLEEEVRARDLENGFTSTLNGASVEIELYRGIRVNESDVILADIHALNGIIHVINRVLIPPSDNLVETAISFNPDEFNALVGAVVQAGLAETLAEGGPFTVFAPTDEAFANLGIDPATLTMEQLQNVLLYHVVEGRVFSDDLVNGPVTTLNGDVIIDAGNLTIDDIGSDIDANLIPSLLNVQATNGVIHVIDKVLIPAEL